MANIITVMDVGLVEPEPAFRNIQIVIEIARQSRVGDLKYPS